MFGLARLQAFLAQRKARGAPILDARRIVYCVDAAARYSPVIPTCLVRSLVLQALLRRGGIASDLRIGVRLDEGRLDAHAWIEAGGVPLNDAPDVAERYGPFAGGLAARSFAR